MKIKFTTVINFKTSFSRKSLLFTIVIIINRYNNQFIRAVNLERTFFGNPYHIRIVFFLRDKYTEC